MTARRPPRSVAYGPAWSDDDDPHARFCAALLPVLRARDVEGFLRVVGDAEELWGVDRSQFSEMAEESLRLIMAGMLRSPRQYGLPPWPAAAAPPAAESSPAPHAAPSVRPGPPPLAAQAPQPTQTAPTQPQATAAPGDTEAPAPVPFNLSLPGFGPVVPRAGRTGRRRPPRKPTSGGGEQLALF